MVHIIRTLHGWAFTHWDKGLLGHFEGLEGYPEAEVFACRYTKGEVGQQEDPLPPQVKAMDRDGGE